MEAQFIEENPGSSETGVMAAWPSAFLAGGFFLGGLETATNGQAVFGLEADPHHFSFSSWTSSAAQVAQTVT